MKMPTIMAATLGLAMLGANLAQAEDVPEPVYAMPAEAEMPVPEVAAPTDNNAVVDSETVGKLKIQNIRVPDRFGTIEEDRVQAMRSEIRYVPSGSTEGYNLVSSSGSQGKSQNAHENNDMKIPSWKLFSW